jgi:acyl carrier protein
VTIQSQAPTPSRESIADWLTQWIAKELGLPVAEIETSQSLLNYSLSSVTAMMLVGDLEEWLGLTLPPTLVWDYPSIDAIVDYLTGEVSGSASETPPAIAATERLEVAGDRLAAVTGQVEPSHSNLDALSDQEVSALLNQLIADERARAST